MARPTICFVPALASRCRFLPLRCRTTSFPLLICSPIGWPPIANMLLVLIATLFTALLPLALLALLLLSSSFPSSPPRSYATSRRFTYDLVGSNVLACAVVGACPRPGNGRTTAQASSAATSTGVYGRQKEMIHVQTCVACGDAR